MNHMLTLLAQAEGVEVGSTGATFDGVVPAVVYAIMGLVVLTLAIVLMSKLMPLPFWKEFEEDQNTALGIRVGSIVIGISIIIAAAIHG